jgi:hypothetical protein
MIMNKKRGVALLAVVLTAVFGAFIIQKSFAATGSIFVSPSSASVVKGSNVTVGIRINPGAATDGVEATMTYDQSKLQYVSMESGSSPYTIQLTASGGNGTVQVARGILGGTVSANNSLVANVTFKALVGGTTANLNLTAGNSTSGGAYNDPGLTDGTVTLKNPTTTTPKPPSPPTTSPTEPKPSTGGSSNTGGNTGSNTNTNTGSSPTPTTPSSNKKTVKVLSRSLKTITVEISAAKPFSVYIKYGVVDQLNLQTIATGFATKHVVQLDKKILVPGTNYSYVIVTKDKDGKEEQTAVQKLKTKGYRIRITVLGKNNNPLKKKKVTLHSDPMTVETDENGVATFEDVAPGNHELEYTVSGKKVTKPIEVADNAVLGVETEEAAPQDFSVVFADADGSSVPTAAIIGLAGVVAVLGLAFVLIRSGKLATAGNRFNRPGGPTAGGPTATTGPMQIGGAGPSGPTTPGSTDELLNKVPGEQRANPGSVIDPNANRDQQPK